MSIVLLRSAELFYLLHILMQKESMDNLSGSYRAVQMVVILI